ncbi:MAG: DUF1854 domain-containing protein [Ruminococcaceae bacterium]|nr:DUF1854 domain-containing protein [Oscillospiraceae bacterium]
MNDKLSISFLPPEGCSFEINANGFLVMKLDGKSIGRVKLIKAYPYSLDDEYICVHDLDDNEIGIIRDLKKLNKSSYENAVKELKNRYYCPTVSAVKSIKERMGHFYFETVIDGKSKSFTVRDLTRNIRFSGENTLLIFDVDGNRYVVPEYEKIEQKSKRLLEPYLY